MFPCEIKQRGTQPTLAIRFRAPREELSKRFPPIYEQLSKFLQEHGLHPAGPVYAAYFNSDPKDFDIEAGVPVLQPVEGTGEIRASTVPGGTYAICHYTGAYSNEGPAFSELAAFAKEKGYKTGTVCYEFYLTEPNLPPSDLRTDLLMPVERVLQIAHA